MYSQQHWFDYITEPNTEWYWYSKKCIDSLVNRLQLEAEKNGKEAPIRGVAQFGEMSHPGSKTRVESGRSKTKKWVKMSKWSTGL